MKKFIQIIAYSLILLPLLPLPFFIFYADNFTAEALIYFHMVCPAIGSVLFAASLEGYKQF